MEQWVQIIPPLPRSEAESRFEQWKLEERARGRTVHEDRVRKDFICAEHGTTLVRYCVLWEGDSRDSGSGDTS